MKNDIWCNPLALENYPFGLLAPGRCQGRQGAASSFIGPVRDFRELADPEVLFDHGKWYMFPSAGDAYVSSDLAHWEYRKILFAGDEKLGYAPSITKCAGASIISPCSGTGNGRAGCPDHMY